MLSSPATNHQSVDALARTSKGDAVRTRKLPASLLLGGETLGGVSWELQEGALRRGGAVPRSWGGRWGWPSRRRMRRAARRWRGPSRRTRGWRRRRGPCCRWWPACYPSTRWCTCWTACSWAPPTSGSSQARRRPLSAGFGKGGSAGGMPVRTERVTEVGTGSAGEVVHAGPFRVRWWGEGRAGSRHQGQACAAAAVAVAVACAAAGVTAGGWTLTPALAIAGAMGLSAGATIVVLLSVEPLDGAPPPPPLSSPKPDARIFSNSHACAAMVGFCMRAKPSVCCTDCCSLMIHKHQISSVDIVQQHHERWRPKRFAFPAKQQHQHLGHSSCAACACSAATALCPGGRAHRTPG